MSPSHLAITAATRGPGRLDLDVGPDAPHADLDEVLAALGAERVDRWWLGGGEPTLLPHLPQLVRTAARGARVGLRTDGLALASAPVAQGLVDLGVDRVQVPVHAARPDAHDWLTGVPGSLLRVLKAVRVARRVGLAVEVEVVVTRPTAHLVAETVRLVTGLGVRRVCLRRLTARGRAAAEFVALAPRLGLVEPHLVAGCEAAARAGAEAVLQGWPRCAARGAPATWAPETTWRVPASLEVLADWRVPIAAGARCAGCDEACQGVGIDYVARFGLGEVRSEGGFGPEGTPNLGRGGEAPATPDPAGEQVPPPPPRAGRAPATRVQAAVRAAASATLAGDPAPPAPRRSPAEAIRVVFPAPGPVRATFADPGPEAPGPTRPIRQQLVEVAQEGAATLRIVSSGSLAHPEAAELLREACRLRFARVEVAGEAQALGGWSDAELRRLRPLARFDLAILGGLDEHDRHAGTGALEAALRGVRRLAEHARVPIGAYAVIRGPEPLAALAAAWRDGQLPGSPALRLHPDGGSLGALVREAERLDDAAMAAAVGAVVPPCVRGDLPVGEVPPEAIRAWGSAPEPWLAPSRVDRCATLDACPRSGSCALAARCAGLPRGWSLPGDR